MRIVQTAVLFAALIGAAASPTVALAQDLAGGVSLGTPGAGLVLERRINDRLVVRGAVDGMSLNRDEDYSDVSYNGKAELMTGGLFADYHPAGGSFLVSGGLYFGKRKLTLDARPTTSVDIGGTTYTPAQVGQLNGEAKLSDVQPFLGVGFDNTFQGDRAWGVRALVGVSFSAEPDLTLRSTGGLLSSDATFQARLRQEEADARDDAKDFRYFPVVQVGLTRRF